MSLLISLPDMAPDPTQIVQSCLQRVWHWQVPPRWTRRDWLDEARAQGQASAYEALREWDGSKGACASTFVQGRVMAGILTLYRREWTATSRTAESHDLPDLPPPGEIAGDTPMAAREAGERRSKPRGPQARPGWETADLQRVMQKMAPEDQKLLRQIFWEQHSEADIARALGISQPAVNPPSTSANSACFASSKPSWKIIWKIFPKVVIKTASRCNYKSGAEISAHPTVVKTHLREQLSI